MNIIRNLKKSLILAVTSLLTIPMQGQDLLARQAPVDKKMKKVDSVALHRLIYQEMLENPAADLYDEWDTEMTHYHNANAMLPDTATIDLRGFHMPTPSRVITSNFGARWGRQHKGLDIKVYIGDTIRAAFSGKVRVVQDQGRRKGYGKYIIIRHTNGLETTYGHLSKQLVRENQVVKAGDVIGLGGNTGFSTGPHLHFETRLLGEKINPEKLFCFEAGDVRGDYYVWRRNGRSQLMAAHDVSNMPAVEDKAEESRNFQQQKMAERSSRARVYKVRSGDTLSKIAKKYGLTVDRLCRLNNISKRKALKPGQILKCS